jgi:hypothetical protein
MDAVHFAVRQAVFNGKMLELQILFLGIERARGEQKPQQQWKYGEKCKSGLPEIVLPRVMTGAPGCCRGRAPQCAAFSLLETIPPERHDADPDPDKPEIGRIIFGTMIIHLFCQGIILPFEIFAFSAKILFQNAKVICRHKITQGGWRKQSLLCRT